MTLGANWQVEFISFACLLLAGGASGGLFALFGYVLKRRSGFLECLLADFTSCALSLVLFLLAVQFSFDGAVRFFHVLAFFLGLFTVKKTAVFLGGVLLRIKSRRSSDGKSA